MERNSGSCNGLEWKNLLASVEMPEHVNFSMCSSNNDDLYFNGIGSSSKNPDDSHEFCDKDGIGSFAKIGSLPPQRTMYDDVMRSGNISSSGSEFMIGLRLGRQKECGDSFPRGSSSSSSTRTAISSLPISSTATKRSRASQNSQNPCCQVEGCSLDLASAKDYHRRHRICESHSKSPKVVVAGMERRFCQQCSRFHELSEFDDKKRSCRRRLSDHNARRRRLQPESIQFNSVGLSSALYDRRPRNVLLNGLPISVSTWENAGSSVLSQGRDSLTRPPNAAGFERTTLPFTSDEIPNSVSGLTMNSSPRVLDQCLQVPITNTSIALDLQSAHSLLSSNSWSLNDADSTSMEGLVHGNYNPFWARFQLDNVAAAEQGVPVSATNSVNLDNAGPSQLQEFQLFKAPYESGCFNSSQRNL